MQACQTKTIFPRGLFLEKALEFEFDSLDATAAKRATSRWRIDALQVQPVKHVII